MVAAVLGFHVATRFADLAARGLQVLPCGGQLVAHRLHRLGCDPLQSFGDFHNLPALMVGRQPATFAVTNPHLVKSHQPATKYKHKRSLEEFRAERCPPSHGRSSPPSSSPIRATSRSSSGGWVIHANWIAAHPPR